MVNGRRRIGLIAAAALLLGWAASASAAMSSANYSIPNDVIAGGGNTMSSANYSLSSTVGQPSPLGEAASAGYHNYPGFWQADEAVFDADGDSLTNTQEATYGTDPYKADTDNDGIKDYTEAITNPCLDPLNDDSDGDGLKDGQEDADHDGVLDPGETNPCNPDSDHDGLTDGEEVGIYFTNPNAWDSDNDFIPDKYEADHIGDPQGSLNPLSSADATLDFDTDGNPNRYDYWNRDGNIYVKDPKPGMFANPGCYYWGENDGDGYPGPADMVAMKQAVSGIAPDYSNIIPHTFDTQDLDRDNYPGAADKTLLDAMIAGVDRPAGFPSSPNHFQIEYAPGSTIKVGDTTHVTISIHNNEIPSVPYCSGFGVVYWVQSGAATLLGGEGTADGQPAGNRYDFSMKSSEHALSTMVIRVDGAGPILINAKMPACGTTPPKGRWTDEIDLASPITITGQ
jgi:hypothetical protein